MPGPHKKRQCATCKKWMRSDNLARHMKTHEDLLDLPDDQLEDELRARYKNQLAEEEKQQKRQKIADAAKNIGTKDSFGQKLNRRYANLTSWFNQPHLTINDSQKRIFYQSSLRN